MGLLWSLLGNLGQLVVLPQAVGTQGCPEPVLRTVIEERSLRTPGRINLPQTHLQPLTQPGTGQFDQFDEPLPICRQQATR